MINFSSVSIRGAFNFSRARVIWHEGELKVFDFQGVLLSTPAQEPTKKPGYLRAWDVKTKKGDIIMRGKCMTCGGKKWWRMMLIPDRDLWGHTR
jgi:hypothetical protein